MRNFVLLTFVLSLLTISNLAIAEQIFLWDYNGSYTIPNPDIPDDYDVEEALINALEANGMYPTVATILPEDLSAYDAVFVSAGIWCFS